MQKLEDADVELESNKKTISELQSNADKMGIHCNELEKQVVVKEEKLKQMESIIQKVLIVLFDTFMSVIGNCWLSCLIFHIHTERIFDSYFLMFLEIF